MSSAAATSPLPRIDEHAVTIDAPANVVWDALVRHFGAQSPLAERYAKVVGTDPSARAGRFPEHGASIVGFGVTSVRANEQLVVAGCHRFSRYALTFDLEPVQGATLLRATTDASFPGVQGAVYRALVIGSGAHRRIVRRLLRTIDGTATRGRRPPG